MEKEKTAKEADQMTTEEKKLNLFLQAMMEVENKNKSQKKSLEQVLNDMFKSQKK